MVFLCVFGPKRRDCTLECARRQALRMGFPCAVAVLQHLGRTTTHVGRLDDRQYNYFLVALSPVQCTLSREVIEGFVISMRERGSVCEPPTAEREGSGRFSHCVEHVASSFQPPATQTFAFFFPVSCSSKKRSQEEEINGTPKRCGKALLTCQVEQSYIIQREREHNNGEIMTCKGDSETPLETAACMDM